MRESRGRWAVVFAACVSAAWGGSVHGAGLESANLRLVLTTGASSFQFSLLNKATNQTVLTSASTAFGATGVTGVSATSSGNDGQHDFVNLTLSLSGGGTAAAKFTLVNPSVVQVDMTGPVGTTAFSQMFTDTSGERYYGVQSITNGKNLDNRGLTESYNGTFVHVDGVNSEGAPAPFYMTSTNVGVYTQTVETGTYQYAISGKTGFTFNTTDGTGSNSSVRFDVMVGNSPTEVIKQFNTVAGPSFMPPTWAFDSIWWRDNEHSIPSQAGVSNAQGLVIKDADMLQQLQMPASAIWLDRPFGTGSGDPGGWGNFDFDSSFPNPAKMISDLKSRGMNLLLWVANRAGNNLGVEAAANNYLVPGSSSSRAIDVRNPAAYAFFESKLNTFVNMGIKGYKIDRGGEGEMPTAMQNEIPTLFDQLAYEGMAAKNGSDFFNFARSPADQARRYAAVWNGDSDTTFTGLETSVKNGLRAGIVGFPMYGSDTGGFAAAVSKEVFARWFEFSTYCPLMEIPLGPNRNVWYDYDSEMVGIAAAQTQAHHDLIPYTRSALAESLGDGMPVMRAMFLMFPTDAAVGDMWDQYMYGPNVLVAPVTTAGATSRPVYLPAGRWVDYNNKSTVWLGQQTITSGAALGVIPVFAREGAIIPRGDIVQDNQLWKANWKASLHMDVFASDQMTSGFDYYTDAGEMKTIRAWVLGGVLHMDFGNLGVPGEVDLYMGRFFTFKTLGNVYENGVLLGANGFTYDGANRILKVPFSGATTLDVVLAGVPEPGAVWVLGCAVGVLMRRRRAFRV